LHVQPRFYQGKADSLKNSSSERRPPLSESLVERVNALRSRLPNSEWMFCSETSTTPVNPGNALKRYIRPVVKGLGISLGGWHDLRHTPTTTLRRDGVDPKIVSGILGHRKVNIALDVYDHATAQDFRQSLERPENAAA
jgi:integrase